jgi:hypothetical protein
VVIDEDSAIEYFYSLNAQISHTLHVPFPELLEEEDWYFKAEQFALLNKNKLLPITIEYKSSKK